MALFRWAVLFGTLLLTTAGPQQAVAQAPASPTSPPMTFSAPGNSLAPTLAATRLGVSLDEAEPRAVNASAARGPGR
jgi:hypothetical protein